MAGSAQMFWPHGGRPRLLIGREAENAEILLEPVNHFAAEMDHFSECVLHDKNLRKRGEMGRADMRAIAAIEEAAQ